MEALLPSSAEFIEKASGIKSRYVVDKSGILNPALMRPDIPERPNEEISILAEIAVKAADEAMERWGKPRKRIGAVLCAASNMQRPYPAMAIEVQACARHRGLCVRHECRLLFGDVRHQDGARITSRRARSDAALVVNPEICSGHLNFRDRDSHFIFGDVATAVIVERADDANGGWDILGTRLKTKFSNNIRNNSAS